MKILIVAARFWPENRPRAHRWAKIAAEWAAEGHEITVLACRQKGQPDRSVFQKIDLRRVGHMSVVELLKFHFLKKEAEKGPPTAPKKPSILAVLGAFLYQKGLKKLFLPDESIFWLPAASRRAAAILGEKKFDALITVSLPFAAQLIGRQLKKRWPELFWLCDIGDPLALHDDFLSARWPFFEKINRQIERDVLEKCDAATVTNSATRAQFELFFGQKLAEKIQIAPPVFEFETVEKATFSIPKKTGELHLGYFGALYRPFRSPEAVVDFLEKTEKTRPALAARLVVHFFGEVRAEFFGLLAASPRVRLHGLRPRGEAQAAMLEMDFLINIGNRGDYLLPSKAVDYLATGLPVLNFSNAENDPFSNFFKKSRALLTLSVKNDALPKPELERFWAWLECEKPRLLETETAALVEPFRAKNVARGLLEILENGQKKLRQTI